MKWVIILVILLSPPIVSAGTYGTGNYSICFYNIGCVEPLNLTVGDVRPVDVFVPHYYKLIIVSVSSIVLGTYAITWKYRRNEPEEEGKAL